MLIYFIEATPARFVFQIVPNNNRSLAATGSDNMTVFNMGGGKRLLNLVPR